MKYLLLFVLPFFLIACSDDDENNGTQCLDEQIEVFKQSSQFCEGSAKVDEYNFNGETVYLFEPGICGADFTSDVYDADCDLVCTLGGFAGITMCDGSNFSGNAKFVENYWESE